MRKSKNLFRATDDNDDLPNVFKSKSVAVGQKLMSLNASSHRAFWSLEAGGTTLLNGEWRTRLQARRNCGEFQIWGLELRRSSVVVRKRRKEKKKYKKEKKSKY